MGFGSAAEKQVAQELTLRAVELGMSPALGGDIRLELAPRTTVLVGKNGAGKSAILERASSAFINVWGMAKSSQPDPGRLSCEFQLRDSTLFRYRCIWSPRQEPVSDEPVLEKDLAVARIEEACALIEADEQILWSVDDGVLVRDDRTSTKIPLGRTLVNVWFFNRQEQDFTFHYIVGPLFEWFSSVSYIGAPIARARRVREEVVVLARPSGAQLEPLQWLAYNLARWQVELPEEFEEFVEIGRRTKVFGDIAIKRYLDPDSGASLQNRKDFVSVAVDGVDLGLLSDGTLRAMRIFMGLLDPGIRLLLIDEPESAAHPGLLSRLLAEIETYSSDRQIVLATQSPQVVNWARPDAIRLVERQEGSTRVRGLDAATLERVERYLHDDDTLGSFIYGGGLDGLVG
jgi:predicted ATPase